jgi:hypothetical protein
MQRVPKQYNHLGFLMGGVTILGYECRPKPFNFAIVDEVDSVLIDEGRNPLLISSQVSDAFVFILENWILCVRFC